MKHLVRGGLILLLVISSLPFAPATQSQTNNPIAIVGATVIDGTGAAPRPANVLIQGERIAAVGADITIPANARVIQAAGQTLLPGLFDLHTHLPYATAMGLTADWPKNLKAYLYSGVTSVVDFGTYAETFEPMRRLISTRVIEGPRISFAARLTTPGGHGAEGGRGDFFSLEVLTPREARAAIRQVLPYKPDVIKVFTDGWRYGTAPDMTSMQEATLAALVDEAHKNGLEVLTHTVTLEGAKSAVRAGVDVIAHGIGNTEVDDELIALMKQAGTTYAPTLAVYEPRGRNILSPLLGTVLEPAVRAAIQPPLSPPESPSQAGENRPLREGAQRAGRLSNLTNHNESGETPRARRWRHLMHNTAALKAGGGNFGLGTDAGVTGTHHGWATLRELQLLVAGGLTPLEAITAATGNSAKALNVDNERGTITVGKLADLVLVEGAPHQNIAEIERISRVFLGGRELDRHRLASEIATPNLTPIPALKVNAAIDNFERPDGRSLLDTRWINSSDSGHDQSRMIFGRIRRDATNHALSVMGRMAEKERPFIRVNVPLSRGAVEPVDARGFRGVRFEARGDGEYTLLVPTRGVRDFAYYQAPFKANGQWRTVLIDFASLKQLGARTPVAWSGSDLLMLTFEIERAPGELGWLELDNISFYK